MLALFIFFTPGRQYNPLQETLPLSWKDFPSDPISRHLAEALLVQSPDQELSWASVEALWAPASHPPITEGSLPLCSSSTGWHCLSAVFSCPLPELHRVTLFVRCLLPPRLVSSIWELSADFHLHIDRGFMAASAWCTGCTSSAFPLSVSFCLTVDGKRSQSASPFPFSAVSQQKKH